MYTLQLHVDLVSLCLRIVAEWRLPLMHQSNRIYSTTGVNETIGFRLLSKEYKTSQPWIMICFDTAAWSDPRVEIG
jgi:hypothetical protein